MKYGHQGIIINIIRNYYRNTIIAKINAQHIQTHYKNRKLNNTANLFKKIFCINEALAKVENNSLKISLEEKFPPSVDRAESAGD